MAEQKIRIRLKAFDHKILDQSAAQIVDAAERTGAVHVGVVALFSFVLNVSDSDSNTAFAFFRRVVDGVESAEFGSAAQGHRFSDGGGKGGFAVVNVADSANIDVRLSSLELLLSHLGCPP